MGPIEERITRKITEAFAPERLAVINESHLHASHHGGAMSGEGETHFRVRVVSEAFAGMNRIERHRALNDLLSQEIADGVHALALEPAAPGETVRW
ncbi:BolA family protein [Oricola thermophila]|uniref:BolA family transcriptional regulator n=1 Tax=Oricola thermophila TaxID=2742145 RepID=A0A6N1VK43_9HYPH|nr:BolA family protein [Oricola thermophila]QKV20145.1 BolA family transcriptional regulator [Oricola thermophila]